MEPIFVIFIIFGSTALVIYKFLETRHKERMAMIEKGVSPADFKGMSLRDFLKSPRGKKESRRIVRLSSFFACWSQAGFTPPSITRVHHRGEQLESSLRHGPPWSNSIVSHRK